MKIKPEHYQHIKATIESKLSKETALWQSNFYARNKISHKRFVFDVSALCDFTKFYCDVIYEYANDDHIYTALSKAMKEIYGITEKDFIKG